MEEIIKKAKEYLKQAKVERTSESFWQVGDETVRIIKKPGRTNLSCSCENFTRFCNDAGLTCAHCLSVLLYESTKKIQVKSNEIIKKIEDFKKIDSHPLHEFYIYAIQDLRGMYG